ncbi:MAG TPA: hypothetical protein PKC69_00785 [Chitinophagaceae bacterium]|nr:hypothetical protein [Chitinophagaceae bacterium]
MTTSATKNTINKTIFAPSVNIIRDVNSPLNYIPTPNARIAFTQMINDYQTGIRCFSIVGAYGIGKSAFLWAFEKNINRKKEYFSSLNRGINKSKEFEFLRIVGEYASLKSVIGKHLGLIKKDFTVQDILSLLDKHYKGLSKSGKGLVIVIDEFGKFLEYASKHNPEIELYFIQQIAEYVNDQQKNIFLITSLHQDFNGYSRSLSASQQKEWDKVKGRLKEITFNEPVEQLLYLASERLSSSGISRDKNFHKLFKSIESAKAFPLKDYFSETIAERLLPFDILSAAVLTLGLQKYGQNERSLFSFIESNDHLGIKDFDVSNSPYFNLANVYDYLIHNYYSFLTTKYNPHYTHWAAIRTAIERVEGLFTDSIADALRLIKAIGLLNIFGSASAKINMDFLTEYGRYSLGIPHPEKILVRLEALKIVRFVKHSNKYILFEGTDLDIELAIDEAGNFIEKVTNVVHHLSKHFEFPYIPAKAVYFEKGTPRFFAFHLSEAPQKLAPEGEIDGFINLIFSDNLRERDIKEVSDECQEAVLYGFYKSTEEIRNLLFEIEKIEKVKEKYADDRVAVRELNSILQHQVKLLNHYVIGNLYSENSSITWFFKGKREKVSDQKSFNRLLSRICRDVYSASPVYRNEMVNKTRLSGALATAKKGLLKNLTEHWSRQDIGFDISKFPPEKTVYLSLLRETGIHRKIRGEYVLTNPTDESFRQLWDSSNIFLESTRGGRRNLKEFVELLTSAPFKLKKGFVDFWIPIFLFCRRDDFALFGKDGYIPTLSDDTLDLVSREPGDFEVKAFDIAGVKLSIFNKYRKILNQSEQENPTSEVFIATVRPFLTFYKELPAFAKNTKKLDKKTLALRDAIAFSRDPEETFFDAFPKALGFSIVQLQKNQQELEHFVSMLKGSIKEIRSCYDELIDEFETFIRIEIVGEETEFPDYKYALQVRFQDVKKHLLLPHQRTFWQRINSELDDRRAWLNSIAQACVGKSLDYFTDEDRPRLFEKLKDTVHELDNLCEISRGGFDERKEIVLKLEVTSFIEGLQKNLVRLPITKNKELIQLQTVLKTKLSGDKQLNIATLAKLLEELLKDEK